MTTTMTRIRVRKHGGTWIVDGYPADRHPTWGAAMRHAQHLTALAREKHQREQQQVLDLQARKDRANRKTRGFSSLSQIPTPPDRSTWLPRAACTDMDPSRFDVKTTAADRKHPPSGKRIINDWDNARVCRGCPVLAECARDSLSTGDTGIIRAGVPQCETATRKWRQLERSAMARVAEGQALPEVQKATLTAQLRMASSMRAQRAEKAA